jgi:hypothetical protein
MVLAEHLNPIVHQQPSAQLLVGRAATNTLPDTTLNSFTDISEAAAGIIGRIIPQCCPRPCHRIYATVSPTIS